ncbi:MAG: hypothetical protein ACYTDY_00325 [Planctomycetota bacterium]|jgi:polyhydroxyalkanoate synthesis regulator phasin
MSRESVLFVTVVNLVLTVVVVWAGLTFFAPEPDRTAPGSEKAVAQEVSDLRRQVQALSERLAGMEESELRVGNLEGRILALEKAPRALPPGLIPTAEGQPGDAPGKPSMESQLVKGIGQMIRQQAKRQRDRFIREISNPTPESEARQARQIRGITEAISRNLGLEERDKAAVERILTDVDNRRRSRLREIVESKASPDDISYKEVKKVLDESFAEEDRLIEQTLPSDKAASYQENAEPFRQFIYVAAQAAFSSTTPTEPKTSDK